MGEPSPARTDAHDLPAESFPALDALGLVRHAFTLRIPGIDVAADRATVLARLGDRHARIRERWIGPSSRVVTAEQVHGREVAVVDEKTDGCVAGVDGLITALPGVCLGIYVADCCAVYLVDPVQRVLALLHAGKKGTELGIVPYAVRLMGERFGSDPRQMVAQLSPCIRPPHYEVDFAAQIVAQARACGISQVADSSANTGAETQRYYSYRIEKGRTGRMLALISMPSGAA